MLVAWKVILVVKPSFYKWFYPKWLGICFFLWLSKFQTQKVKLAPPWADSQDGLPFPTFLRLAHPRQSGSATHRRRGAEAPRSEGGQGGSGKGGACGGTAAQTQGQLLFALPWGFFGGLSVVFFSDSAPEKIHFPECLGESWGLSWVWSLANLVLPQTQKKSG